MIDIADRPEIQAQIAEAEQLEQIQAEPAPQYTRAPEGNGHEVALNQGSRQR